jgi:hypothetical protein
MTAARRAVALIPQSELIPRSSPKMASRQTLPEPKPIRMPNLNDPEILAARRRVLEQAMSRTGRASTILSDMLRSVNGSIGLLGR